MNLKLEKSEHSSRVTLDGKILKSFNGYFDVEDQDHNLIKKLYKSFTGLNESEVNDGSVIADKYEENKIFQLYKRLTEGKEGLIKENFHHFIQWAPVFRACADPRMKMNQYAFYGPLFNWLKSQKLEMEDLPANYCQSIEEFDLEVKEYEESGSTFKVSDPLVKAIVDEALSLEPKKQAGLMYLYFTFDEPIFPLLFMLGACSAEEMAKGALAANSEIPGCGISKPNFAKMLKFRKELAEMVFRFVE